MSITLRTATGTFNTGSLANPIGTEPAGTAAGDVLVALVVHENTANSITGPGSWSQLAEGGTPTAASAGFRFWFGYIVRGASAPSLTWTSTGAVYYETHIIGLVGVDNASPIDAQSSVGSTVANSGTGPDPPAATATLATDMAVTAAGHWSGSVGGGWTAPGSYTLCSNNTTGNDGMIAYRLLSAAGSEDPGAFTDGTLANSDKWNGMTVLFKDASAVAGPIMTKYNAAQMRTTRRGYL